MALSLSDIERIFLERGHRAYDGEPVSHLLHALQTATLAERDGAGPGLVTACLLHDLGHLIADHPDTPTLRGIDDKHQYFVLPFLRGLFGKDVLEPIRLHVEAKRYLCFVEPAYGRVLSENSRRSLLLQGGTLPILVRLLRIDDGGAEHLDHTEQRRLDDELRDAAASAMQDGTLAKRDGKAFSPALLATAGRRFTEPPDDQESERVRELLELRLAIIETMRSRLVEISSGGVYSTVALRHALAELDADQLSLELRLVDQEE